MKGPTRMAIFQKIRDMKTMKTLLSSAEHHARSMGEDLPGAEHLLLAAFDLPEESAARSFQAIGADPSQFRGAIVAAHEKALKGAGISVDADLAGEGELSNSAPGGLFRSKPSVQAALQQAAQIGKESKSGFSGAQIVLAVATQTRGTAANALREMGVDLGALQAAAREQLSMKPERAL
jgi:ATP-dependent Clp protease ATP-binding subunit ClpA